MKSDALFLSIIIATVDRPAAVERLFQTLQACLPLCRFQTEAIVVDQSRSEALRQRLEPFARQFPVRYYRLKERHAGKARNFGAGQARGQWLAFADDDCLYTSSTLPALKAAIDRDAPHLLLGGVSDFTGKRIGGARKGRGMLRPLNTHRNVSETALFVRRELFLRLGGFDDRYGPGSLYGAAEGLELVWRTLACERNALLRYDASIRVLHPRKDEEGEETLLRTGYLHGYGAGAVVRKHHTLWAAAYVLLFGLKFMAKLLLDERANKRVEIHRLRGFQDGLRLQARRYA